MEKPVFIDTRKKKRPELLTLLLILTFISSGIHSIAYLSVVFLKDLLLLSYELNSMDTMEIVEFLKMPASYFQLNLLFTITALAGAIFMWIFKKIGFHIYSLSKIALLFIMTIYTPFNTNFLFPILTTSLFILLYYRHIKYLS